VNKDKNKNFQSISGVDNDLVYSSKNSTVDYSNNINSPGEYPYTRGIHKDMYRGKIWTMRQFAGFGLPKETNKRFKFLLNKGQTGLSVAFDMPTLMGYDPDHDISVGEVGHCGVSISNLQDMEILFDGIDLSKVSVSMTINGPAIVLFAFYLAVAIKRNINISLLNGTLQNDILKEYIAQKEWIFPPKESMRIVVDMIKYCSEKMPHYNTVSVSGYHIREAGSTAQQELAFTLADGYTYIDYCLEAGLKVDQFAPRLSFFFNSHSDFFEEIAKFRAARRIWSKLMKNKYKAKDPRSLKLRFHTQTAGFSLTAQQPENNISRTAFQAMSAVLGGTQSLHTNSMDETLALPSEKAAEIALRTQQILAYETGVINVVDPLGGSWYVEELTNNMERRANDYFDKINEFGGVIPCIENGYLQREIADAASDYNNKIENNNRVIVGVNKYNKDDEGINIPILKISKNVESKQVLSIKKIKKKRNNKIIGLKLNNIEKACKNNDNLVPVIIDAVLEYATLGEIINSMKNVFGEWNESSVI